MGKIKSFAAAGFVKTALLATITLSWTARAEVAVDPPNINPGLIQPVGPLPLPIETLLLQEFTIDATRRMIVPVQINGSKPFPFIVDTGSERTVIATDLAQSLGLENGRMLRLATVSGPATVPSFLIDSLTTSTLSLDAVEAPGLERTNLGAFGLLGIDSLQDNKLFLDFRAPKMEVLPSPKKRGLTKLESGMIVVTARRKAGRLVISNASLNGMHVDIVIDTGAQSSLGNYALRDKLLRRNRGSDFVPIEMSSVVGTKLEGNLTQIREIELGGVRIQDMPIVFSENYAAKVLGLENRPAIFLGMDALRLFDKVVIDFVNNRVSFLLPKTQRRGLQSRL